MSARLVRFKDLDDRGNNAREASVFEVKTRLSWRNLMRLASVASMAALTTLLVGSANAMPTPAPYRADADPLTIATYTAGAYRTVGAAGSSWRQDFMAAAGTAAAVITTAAATI